MENTKPKRSSKLWAFLGKIWRDPVVSKVISAGIIFGIASIPSAKLNYKIVTICLIIIAGLAVVITIVLVIKKRLYIRNYQREKGSAKENQEELPNLHTSTTSFFASRIANAFPGQRGIQWYEAKTAVKRLKLVFRSPLKFSIGNDGIVLPIWWFRAGSSSDIERFKVLSKTKVLLGWDELEINRIAVNRSNRYYKCFIYIEAKAEKPIGLYKHDEKYLNDWIEEHGFYSEEYALLGSIPIKSEERDDGAAIIKRKVVNAYDAEIRIRFLSNYNLLITAQDSPYNSSRFDNDSDHYMNQILRGNKSPEDFFEILETYRKDEE